MVVRDFKPPRGEGEADYSALVISFSKRCRQLAAQNGQLGYGMAPGAAAQVGAPIDAFGLAELENFRIQYPMDDRAFTALQELTPEVRRQVIETFVPKRADDTDFSAPVMAYARVCRARAAEAAQMGMLAGATHQVPGAPLGQGMMVSEAAVGEFCRRYPVDARCLEAILAAPPMVQTRVIREFKPKQEGEADYSAAVMAFLGACRRAALGTFGGGAGYFGPGPPKRPRFF